jgi:hypothetical protein
MSAPAKTSRPSRPTDPAAIDPAWSDQELVAWAAERVSVPREAVADSFVLHAPLELAARAALLPFVAPAARHRARQRLVVLADGFEQWGPPIPPHAVADFGSLDDATVRFVEALRRGELDDIDVAASWLGDHASGAELRRRLIPEVLPRLGAAAHAPIFFFQLPRVAPRRELTARLLRGLARELGRVPDWQLRWIANEDRGPDSAGPTATADDVFASVAGTPSDPEPDRQFIYPVMSFVDEHGIAAENLAPVARVAPGQRAEAGRALLRAAAWAMLVEDDEFAPYGWTHCLTLPQAVLGTADAAPDPVTALLVAGTYVVGFRSAMGRRPLTSPTPAPTDVCWREALEADRATAAAAVWHAPEAERVAVVSALATRAATGHDAHLVKYTLACIDAAADDTAHAPLFLAAAASLGAWWEAHGDPSDPLA